MATLDAKKVATAILAPAALVAGMVVGVKVAVMRKQAVDLKVRDAALAEEGVIPEEGAVPEDAFEKEDLETTG